MRKLSGELMSTQPKQNNKLRRSSALAFAAAAAVMAGIVSTPAKAGSISGTINVEINISSACLVNGATSVSSTFGSGGKILFTDQPGLFGNVDGQLVGSLGNLSVQCSPGIAPVLTVGAGANDQGGNRRMASGANRLVYHLFSDAARQDEITVGGQISLGTMTSQAVEVPIYARVNSGGVILPAGQYVDTVQVTLAW